MSSYTISIFARSLFSLMALLLLSFVLIHLIPGDPFTDDQALPTALKEKLLDQSGLNQPLAIQFFSYVKKALRLDFGNSLFYDKVSARALVFKALISTCSIGAPAFLLAFIAGSFAAYISFLYPQEKTRRRTILLCRLFLSIPSFVCALVLQLFLAVKLPLFSLSGNAKILPILSLSILPACQIILLFQRNVLEISNKNFIKAAKLKGLSPSSLFCRHVYKNSLIPLLPFITQIAAQVLTGSFAVETVFSLPGLGRVLVMSIFSRDYPVILLVTLLCGFVFIALNTTLDLVLPFLDPRISKEQKIREKEPKMVEVT